MKIKILKFITLFAVACISFSCKNSEDESNIDMSKIDFSNIEDLHAQPLPVIQKCVEGKWQWHSDTFAGNFYSTYTFVDITENKWVETMKDSILYIFSYRWEKKTTPSGYTTYVMWDNEHNSGMFYFDSIKNDTLSLCSFNPGDFAFFRNILVRIK